MRARARVLTLILAITPHAARAQEPAHPVAAVQQANPVAAAFRGNHLAPTRGG